MNKTALRSFSAWARRYLISNICDRAQFLGITKDNVVPIQAQNNDSFMVNGVTFDFAPSAREHFVEYVKEVGWENAIEEIAYTWFNRILAIRFMEVNGYLENGIDGSNIYVIGSIDVDRKFPDAVARATELKYVDKDTVFKYQDNEDNAGLFRYILMKQCLELSKWMPDVFEKVSDYTDLLLPETLLFPDGFVEHLTNDLNAEDFDISAEGNGQVEIFGWMYQFYIAEKKDDVFRSKAKITKSTLPAATQLFTPDWIVRYMVENTLGKVWISSHGESRLRESLKYYLDPEPNDEEVIKIHEEIKKEYQTTSIRDIKFIDPCCGSGHILVYAFDIFYRMYLEEGYTADMIPSIILENNLFGLDVDKRAIQLTSFALTMKARSYNNKLFQDGYHFPNVIDIRESNTITDNDLGVMSRLLMLSNSEADVLKECVFRFKNAEYYGSLINSFSYAPKEYEKLIEKIEGMDEKVDFDDLFESAIFRRNYLLMCTLVKQARVMSDKYDCMVTNPPYISPTECGDEVKQYAETFYPDSKKDMCTMFIERCFEFSSKKGLSSMITMQAWMTSTTYKKLREKMMNKMRVVSMVHLGPRAFEDISGEVVQTTAWVMRCK
ncbi:BREX-1 system adenine-specific DNA-methyltransferase PglX [Butyrivibrio sp. NC2007]|uniref:BREX-1 system adenine-specific DNA-methyltransferase PglX n=1 Tax=Butyrivibrio sp. NC2007 TaxID=1280683 RepID=UPI0003B6CBDF|nr:BREX-1 system adenine-specific DNA-methyltransferase PglX [Butyrivibrio sp. NC2007]